jgi:AraC-like DNA-binding protein
MGFPQLVAELGGDADGLLSAVGLRRADCGRLDTVIPLRNAIQAVELAAARTGKADFGRRLADRQSIEILGAVGVAARTASTFGQALQIFGKFMAAYSPGIAVMLEPAPGPGTSFLAWRATLTPPFRHPQTAELALGIALGVFRLLLGPQYRPVSVHLPHGPLAAREDYVRYYGCPALFGVPTAGFTLRATDLGRPLSEGSDPAVHDGAMAYLAGVLDGRVASAAHSVAELMVPLLPSGTVSVQLVARQFGMHPKALQRRLAAEGTCFSNVLDQVRRRIAERCLLHTEMSLVHLTYQLGFAEQSVLTRACRRWFDATSHGLPPGAAGACRAGAMMSTGGSALPARAGRAGRNADCPRRRRR